eukprot:TRINITY_DN2252_c0_g1_i15.p1 TRINITY_DN2252_c0_g1~~TRINITY_DN2252_c0_g1_i15.p1  ORF type:complete len:145 (+),score=21.14 TRINITY_DN2252_c0_g1_i15:953-1387(+)
MIRLQEPYNKGPVVGRKMLYNIFVPKVGFNQLRTLAELIENFNFSDPHVSLGVFKISESFSNFYLEEIIPKFKKFCCEMSSVIYLESVGLEFLGKNRNKLALVLEPRWLGGEANPQGIRFCVDQKKYPSEGPTRIQLPPPKPCH